MTDNWLLERLMMLVPLVLSLSVHEWAHAASAYQLGDDTAARMGRMTLNPLAHIDPVGTLLLPLLGIPFGWARPVPVVPARFNRSVTMRMGMVITAAAGPLSNLLLAFMCVLVFVLVQRFAPFAFDETPALAQLLATGLSLNVALFVFNALPIPPLDGSRVVDGLISDRHRSTWIRFTSLAPYLMLALIFFGGSVISWPTRLARSALITLASMIAGI